MTMPDERTRALRFAREILEDLIQREDVPFDLKQQAKVTLRHYPDDWTLRAMTRAPGAQWLAPPEQPMTACLQGLPDQQGGGRSGS